MNIFHYINRNFCRAVLPVLAGFCALLLTACSGSDSVVDDTELQGDCMYIRISLNYSGAPASRANNPTPGQDGDGREPGINEENHIYDVCVFIYDGGSDYVNAPANTPIIASAYATESQLVKRDNAPDGDGYQGQFSKETLPVKIPRIPVTQHTQAIVVANMGNILGQNIHTLGDLRDRIVAESWKDNSNPEECSHFTMASSSISFTTNVTGGTIDNPILFECNIERTMARIDFCWLNGPNFSTEGYDTYDVVSRLNASNKLGEVYVTNMRLFNVMQQPTYFLKRVALNVGETIDYLGRETVYQGQANNYVIEPRTTSKTTANRTNATLLQDWFGNTRVGLLTNNAVKQANATFPYNTRTLRNLDFRGNTVRGFIMAYANENTMDAMSSCAEFCTGILFETIYKPAVVYNYDKDTKTLTANSGYTLGTTFTHYIAIDNVMDESNNLCFMTEQEAVDYRNDNPLQPADIKTYVGGRSYYRMWIKHANDGNNEVNGKMEYGIVRNNIYRIAVSAFNGPGTTEPDADKQPELISPYIFVKPWDVVVMPDVVM